MQTDRVALVTGCGRASGIGSATALALAAQGNAVLVTDIAESGVANRHESDADSAGGDDGLARLCERIRSAGGRADYAIGDVSAEDDAERMIRAAVEKLGRIDILVNNAAAPHGADRADIAEVPFPAWQKVMSVNINGAFLMSRAAIRVMRPQRWGRIVNLSSVAIKHALSNLTAYTTSKAAIVGFSQSLAMDVAADGITVNAVCPGITATPRAVSSARRVGGGNLEAGLAMRSAGIPVGRMAEPGEIAALICFLASDAAAYITGQAILIDGGGVGLPHTTPRKPAS